MRDKFFSKLDWAAFWTATVLTLVVYALTLGPSVGLEDSGELATAAARLGVPHPPGYPFWTFCSWIFCKVFGWVSYMGHPTPAWCVSLASAVFGAFAAGCTAMLICRSARDFLDSGNALRTTHDTISFAGGVAGAFTFALSPVEWSQSTIVEIYSLNALFLMWVFLLSYRWMRKPSDKILWSTAFVFGLGLTNYQVLLFAIVPLALVIAFKNLPLFRDVALYLIPVALTCQILQIGQLVRADRYMSSDAIAKHAPILERTVSAPSGTLIAVGVIILVGCVVASVFIMDRQKARQVVLFGGGFGAVLILLSSFVFVSDVVWSVAEEETAPLVAPGRYAFIAAMAACSVISAVLAAISREKEEKRFSSELIVSIGFATIAIIAALMVPSAGLAGYRGEPYPWAKSSFIFILLIGVLFGLAWPMRKGLSYAIPVAGLQIAVFILLSKGAMNGLSHPAGWWFWWPIAWNFVLLALVWVTLPNGRSVAGAAFFCQLGISFYAYMPIVSDMRNPPMNWGYPRTWEGFKHALMRGQYEAIGFKLPSWEQIVGYFEDVRVQFTDLLIPFAPVPFAAGHFIVRKENRRAFWQWMIPALVCFLLMSFLLIGLANVKGDLQDGFIQKVKFIASHAMLAVWIGYGMIFTMIAGLVLAARFIKRAVPKSAIFLIAFVMIIVAFVYPIIDNYCGEYILGVNEVSFKLGGSEQNGHTFGWQFGAYQLEGAKAINEQLEADEEPLPDPTYPPPMDDFSIFFGGTDPGRFVPTYMIYCANYRPDIYLITQNALADDTYMSVQRDLYGDEIWIPSKEDSADAFSIYAEEIQSGKRQANGAVSFENGRMQVTGALGVMEINGILTKMMHQHDRLRHSFYVEESYQIPWMFPYLSPHGLIMKLNAEKVSYDERLATKDRDFWDWYMRRLLDDPMYRRDFAGQKSFSKLRAALAGLYGRQGYHNDAAQAFREAVILYPASPEANFRYVQEVLLPTKRYDVVLDMLDYTDYIDPNNRRTGNMREFVERISMVMAEIERLENKGRDPNGKLLPHDKIALATCYYQIGRTREAAQLLRGELDSIKDADILAVCGQILSEAGVDADAEKVWTRYLKTHPGDLNAWVCLSRAQYHIGKRHSARESLSQAYQMNPSKVERLIQNDQELYEIVVPANRRK